MRKPILSAIIIVAGLTMAVMGSQLFVQNFASVPASTAVLTANCTAMFSSPSSVAPGSTGGLFFGCVTSGCVNACLLSGPAITVAADGAATPSFNLPSPYTSVNVVNVGNSPPTGGCSPLTSGPTLLNGDGAHPFSFTGNYGKGNSFYYCVGYNAPSGTTSLPQFDISWTQ